mgnify:CR=1 FL=1
MKKRLATVIFQLIFIVSVGLPAVAEGDYSFCTFPCGSGGEYSEIITVEEDCHSYGVWYRRTVYRIYVKFSDCWDADGQYWYYVVCSEEREFMQCIDPY